MSQQSLDREARVFWNSMRRELAPVLQKQWKDAAHFVEHGNPHGVAQAVKHHEPEMQRVFMDNLLRIANKYQNYGPKLAGRKDIKSPLDSFWSATKKHIREQTALKVTFISATTRSVLKGIIEDGLADELTYSDIAKNLIEIGGIANKTRAMLIARTECHSMQSYAIDESVKSTGIDFAREWSAVMDERTRVEHSKANGQRVKMDEPFTVGGEELMYPGDTSGSPGNVCRCRCSIEYKNEK